jgi:hypothetical protein
MWLWISIVTTIITIAIAMIGSNTVETREWYIKGIRRCSSGCDRCMMTIVTTINNINSIRITVSGNIPGGVIVWYPYGINDQTTWTRFGL